MKDPVDAAHALRDVIGEDMFEKGIDTALSENLNHHTYL